MNLTRCSNGHFYDMDKYDRCPHCQGSAMDIGEKTTPLGGGPSMVSSAPLGGGATDVTVPIDFTPSPGLSTEGADLPTEPLYSDGRSIPKNEGHNKAGNSSKQESSLNKAVEKSQGFSGSTDKTVGIYSSLARKGKEGTGQSMVEPVVGWLVCVRGSSFGASFTLISGKNFIGRDASMDVCIPGDKSISRQCHAILIYDPKSKKFLVQPGTSRELFYLNDSVVLGVEEIVSNDVMTVGNTDLMFIPCCSDVFSWEDQIKKNSERE